MVTVQTPNGKRITAKAYINTRNKPIISNGMERYPLYLQIIYNRKIAQIPYSFYDQLTSMANSYYTEEEFIQKFINRELGDPKEINKFFSQISESLRYEIKKYGEENLSLKGIGKRFTTYRKILLPEFSVYCTDKLNNYLRTCLHDKEVRSIASRYSAPWGRLIAVQSTLEDRRYKARVKNFPEDLKNLLLAEYLLLMLVEYDEEDYTFLGWLTYQPYTSLTLKRGYQEMLDNTGLVSKYLLFKDLSFFKIEDDLEIYINIIEDFIHSEIDLM